MGRENDTNTIEKNTIEETITFPKKAKIAFSDFLSYLSQKTVIFASSIITFIFVCLEIYNVADFQDIYYAFAMATVFALPATLLSEKLSTLKKYFTQILVATAGGFIGYFSKSNGFGNHVYSELYYFGIAFSVISASLFLFIPKKNPRTYFAGIFKHFLFCSFMSLIVLGGSSLLVYAVQNLILNTEDYDIYLCCVGFSTIVFALNSFTFYLFNRREEESSGKAFKVIVLYIMLPAFTLLVAILYAYLAKALILFKLPSGQINWFVSFASCFYIVFYFILREYDELPVIRVFYKFGAFIFIPLICIQIPAYFIRINSYGFTGWRYSSLLFIIFSILTIALTFVKKGQFTKYSLLILTALILFDSLSPFNLINMAYKSQYSRLIKVMEKYDLYDRENDALTNYDRKKLEKTITDEDRDTIASSYNYIVNTSRLPNPKWATDEKKSTSFDKVFGIQRYHDKEKRKNLNGKRPTELLKLNRSKKCAR
ncbi:DUF4153 domain-containing protein [Treponema zioleckii]|uniref:DUF4153 domain-containing protein n=1 Tax=Treponema zioleckii TaxID=331680 RepID=UPI00168A6EB4|nr:DUF4153 domain-containing protein [Treponema zioleckii]